MFRALGKLRVKKKQGNVGVEGACACRIIIYGKMKVDIGVPPKIDGLNQLLMTP